MKIEVHQHHNLRIAEIISDELVITNVQDGLDLRADMYYQNFDKIILHQKNIIPAFFDLKTGIAGEISLINYKLISGLNSIDLHASDYHIYLGDTIFKLMGLLFAKSMTE